MKHDIKPVIVVSKCLGFSPCRYNGGIENNSFVDKLKDFVEFIDVCPEVGSGLSTPRECIRIVLKDGDITVVETNSGICHTKKMNDYCESFLNNLDCVDGFILKTKSPSCANKDAKIYLSAEKGSASKRGKGLFASKVSDKFPNTIIEDEGRLTNFKIREHFLTRVYLLAKFRKIKSMKSISALKEFHLENTLLFLAYNQKYSKLLDSLIFGDTSNLNDIILNYEIHLLRLLDKAPRYTSNINVLLKTIAEFKDKISKDELNYIYDTIDKYKNSLIPFSVPLYLVKGYIIRFKLSHLIEQSFFMPYPDELIVVTDSGKLVH